MMEFDFDEPVISFEHISSNEDMISVMKDLSGAGVAKSNG
jgi:hypothetical protein